MIIKMNYHPSAPQRRFHETDADEALFGGEVGSGKLLDINTLIPTLDGWTMMGDINVGDIVFDMCGKPCEVTYVSPVQYDKTYKLVFSDGSEIIAGASHQWVTETYSERMQKLKLTPEYRAKRRETRVPRGTGKKPWLAELNSKRAYKYLDPIEYGVRTTQEIADTLISHRQINHAIPVCGAIETQEKNLMVDPYLLGAWLGDGSSDGGSITGTDPEIFEAFRAAGYTLKQYADITWGVNGLRAQLRLLGVRQNKHIPQEYLRASIEQRKELLRGIMDTDGYCETTGYCEFTNTNRVLSENVRELLCGLGIKATITTGRATLNGKDCGEKYRISFVSEFPVFRLKRKLDRQKLNGFRGTHNRRYIVKAEEIARVPMQCISVSSETETYLAGRTFIPTHNTKSLVMDAMFAAAKYPGIALYVFRPSYKEAEDSILEEIQRSYPKEIGTYVKDDSTFYFINGSKLKLRQCKTIEDAKKNDSKEFGKLYIDEPQALLFEIYDYLCTRVRANTELEVKPQIKLTAMQGGKGHSWIKRTYVDPLIDTPNVPVEVSNTDARTGEVFTITREFIPAATRDNKYVDAGYLARMNARSEKNKKRLLTYDWNAVEGQAFKEWVDKPLDEKGKPTDRNTHVIHWEGEIPDHWPIIRGFDYGRAKPYSVLWFAQSDETYKGRLFLIAELYGGKEDESGLDETASQIAKKIADFEKPLLEKHGFIDGVADPSIFGKSAFDDESIASVMEMPVLDSNGNVIRHPVTFRDPRHDPEAAYNVINNRILGKALIHELLLFDADGYPGLQVFDTCKWFRKHFPELVADAKNPDDVDSIGTADHDYDAARLVIKLTKGRVNTPVVRAFKRRFDPLDFGESRYSGNDTGKVIQMPDIILGSRQ